jgi:hypothetical protein
MNIEMIKKIESFSQVEFKKFEALGNAECKIQDKMLEIECKAPIPKEYLKEYQALQEASEYLKTQMDELLDSQC